MTVLDVFVNDRKRCRAGVGADGVLAATVNWVRLTGEAARRARRERQPLEEARLHVGGLRGETHRVWIEEDLEIGDRVTVALARATAHDPPKRRTSRMPKSVERPAARLLNVDLDIASPSPLEELARAFEPEAFALYVGREGRRYGAHLEMRASSSSADELIRGFARLVTKLPRGARRAWDHASRREFNIGIQTAAGGAKYELNLRPATVSAAARVNASIGLTLY